MMRCRRCNGRGTVMERVTPIRRAPIEPEERLPPESPRIEFVKRPCPDCTVRPGERPQ